MSSDVPTARFLSRNVRLYPWFQFCRNLAFWQAIWFLYFQGTLSAAEAILLYAADDLATTALEVPSGYLSDRVGRRITLILAMLTSALGTMLIAVLAVTSSVLAIGLLLLRMVPDSFARPVMMARTQPLLDDASRATYLSLQSFAGRLAYAGSLILLSAGASDIGAVSHADISQILIWYVLAGAVVLTAPAATSWSLRSPG